MKFFLFKLVDKTLTGAIDDLLKIPFFITTLLRLLKLFL